MSRRAILLGVSGHPRAIAVIRSLGRAGIQVVGVESDDVLQRPCSRYLQATSRVNPTTDELLPFIEGLGRSGGGVLMALDDDYLILAAKHSGVLSRFVTLTMPPWDVLRRVMDHTTLYRIARQLGLETPSFFKPDDAGEMRRIISALDLTGQEYLLIPGSFGRRACQRRWE